MIERFNFYDLYGYLIPGVVVVLTLGFPFALTSHLEFGNGEWTVLIVGVIAAYLVGHILQTMASSAISSSANRYREKHLYPSARIVSADDFQLTDELKKRIESLVRSWFGLEIEVHKGATKELSLVRQDAFELARRVVVVSSNYAEQFQGLYIMMRGTTAALWLAAPYYAGWALGSVPGDSMRLGALFCLSFGVLGFAVLSIQHFADLKPVKRLNVSQMGLCSLGLAFFGAGYLLGSRVAARNEAYVLLVVAITYVAISLRTLSSTRFFAGQFAKAVWVHFAAQPINRADLE